MADDAPPPRRRPRYKGTHPRRFNEKYKELDPLRYADEKLKVAARGQTPAGSHRSIMVEEILEHIYPHLESGKIKPLVDSIFPLAEVEEAHSHMESGEHMGKIILRCSD